MTVVDRQFQPKHQTKHINLWFGLRLAQSVYRHAEPANYAIFHRIP